MSNVEERRSFVSQRLSRRRLLGLFGAVGGGGLVGARDGSTTTVAAETAAQRTATTAVPAVSPYQALGVRPIINESKALIGLHPVHRRLGMFNGLGSKGVLHAPFFACLITTTNIRSRNFHVLERCRNFQPQFFHRRICDVVTHQRASTDQSFRDGDRVRDFRAHPRLN